MPGKLPKVFQRRKSSGNALEEVENLPTQGTFRVFERPQHGRNKSFDGTHVVKNAGTVEERARPNPKISYEDDENGDLFPVTRPNPADR